MVSLLTLSGRMAGFWPNGQSFTQVGRMAGFWPNGQSFTQVGRMAGFLGRMVSPLTRVGRMAGFGRVVSLFTQDGRMAGFGRVVSLLLMLCWFQQLGQACSWEQKGGVPIGTGHAHAPLLSGGSFSGQPWCIGTMPTQSHLTQAPSPVPGTIHGQMLSQAAMSLADGPRY
jgi:hypothetical protein